MDLTSSCVASVVMPVCGACVLNVQSSDRPHNTADDCKWNLMPMDISHLEPSNLGKVIHERYQEESL